ncbi:MAG: hypothetical protein ABSC25_19705 [Roseiarcus sp.]
MRRRNVFACLALASMVCAAHADLAPPPLQLVHVDAGGLSFQIVLRDYSGPVRPAAELIGCVDGHPNCALARSRGLIGKALRGIDGQAFRASKEVPGKILEAFQRAGAPASIELDFEPDTAGGEPLRVEFSRR